MIEIIHRGAMMSIPGMMQCTDVRILVTTITGNNREIDTFNALKFGCTEGDLLSAICNRDKIKMIEFPNEKIKLFGVMPMEMTPSENFVGNIFTCSIDAWEKIND